jgi:N-acetylglucosaminyl-diphospho-decaprenol L-rhamnosyltransferase
MESPARVTIVTVTYGSAAEIVPFLEAIPAGMPLVVVDNAGGDATPALVRARRADAKVLELPVNLGFGAGCNRGLDQVGSEFALLLNPDARFDAAALAPLLALADAGAAPLLAPLILDEQGRAGRSWNVRQARRPLLPRRRDSEPWPVGPFCADYASGACLLLRMGAGLRFDEAFFLFYEDDDLCARAGGVVVVPAAGIRHAGGRSGRPSARVARLKAWHMAWSRLRFAALHGKGPEAARAEARVRLRHHAARALGHALTLRLGRVGTDLAGLAGTVAWLRGRPADRRL